MGAEQHFHVFKAAEVVMGDCLQPLSAQAFHFPGVVHDVSQAIELSGIVELLFRFFYGSDNSEAKSGIAVDFYSHGQFFFNASSKCDRSRSICCSRVMSPLSSSIASAALRSGETSRVVSILSRSTTLL